MTGIGFVRLACAFSLGVASGCLQGGANDYGEQHEALGEEVASGTLVLQLTSAGEDSSAYRLRNAYFELGGPTETLIDGDFEAADDATLRREVLAGTYQIMLLDGWVLERMDAHGAVPVQASLASDNPLAVEILPGGMTRARFRFTTSDAPIDGEHGDVELGILVQGPAACSPGVPDTCDPGLHCYPDVSSGAGRCLRLGTVALGDACQTAGDCEPGLMCMNDSGVGQLRCQAACNLLNPACTSGVCRPSGLPYLGYCDGARYSTCDPVTQNGCDAAQACYPDQFGTGTCSEPGQIPLGGQCAETHACVAGAACVSVNSEGDESRCLATCRHRVKGCRVGSCIDTKLGFGICR